MIAFAPAASFFCRLTKGSTYAGRIKRKVRSTSGTCSGIISRRALNFLTIGTQRSCAKSVLWANTLAGKERPLRHRIVSAVKFAFGDSDWKRSWWLKHAHANGARLR